MGDKEEAENDRRKLMNKIFCSALTAVVAGAMPILGHICLGGKGS